MQLDFESYRKDQWEHLKHFRTKYDNEHPQTESIFSKDDIQNKKKEMDKLIINAIRLSIIAEEYEKVFSYMDMLHFAQSLKVCVKLSEQLNAHDLASRISKFVQDKEQKDLMLESYKKSTTTTM